jgi:hypothetical protein
MASKKATGKRLTKKRASVTIIAGVIMAIGAVTAGVIGILPKLTESAINNRSLVTLTPIVFSKYDDPLGLFSIEYPSDFYVLRRTIEDRWLAVAFAARKEEPAVISLFAARDSPGLSAQNKVESLIDEMLTDTGRTSELLISNKKTNKGYLVHSELVGPNGKGVVEYYNLNESENDIHVAVLLRFPSNNPVYDNGMIQHIFSSFTWSYVELDKQFLR